MKTNFYRTAKAILSEGMAVNHWWQNEDISEEMFPITVQKLEKAFGKPALIRGIQNALADNEAIPEIVQKYATT